MDRYEIREIDEAVRAADEAIRKLREAKKLLGSAGGWGLVDILGGGMFSTFMKHSKMGQAERKLSDARDAVRRFGGELSDVQGIEGIDLETGDFLYFADYFLDGFLADWFMQSRIDRAKKEVDEAIREISSIRLKLLRAKRG